MPLQELFFIVFERNTGCYKKQITAIITLLLTCQFFSHKNKNLCFLQKTRLNNSHNSIEKNELLVYIFLVLLYINLVIGYSFLLNCSAQS